MDVVLPIFMKTCCFRFLEETVDTLPLIILLKRWNCNLMAGESHRLSGVKRNFSVVLMDWILLKALSFYLCATWQLQLHSPLHQRPKVRGWICSHCFSAEFSFFCHVRTGGREDWPAKSVWCSYWLCQYVCAFKGASGLFLFPGKERAYIPPQFPGEKKPLCS